MGVCEQHKLNGNMLSILKDIVLYNGFHNERRTVLIRGNQLVSKLFRTLEGQVDELYKPT